MKPTDHENSSMSFCGYAGIPDPQTPGKTTPGIIREWYVKEGNMTVPRQKIGAVEIAGIRYGVLICFPAKIQRLYAKKDSAVSADDVILKWLAEGEVIPSFRNPYFQLEASENATRF